jgi:ATP-dependent DNA helicase RecG
MRRLLRTIVGTAMRRAAMPEQQTIEYKQSWHDDHLRQICGFANAQGGTLFVGRNDAGHPVGVIDAARLLTDLPNKIRNALGITADVNLCHEEGCDVVEIIAPAYAVPISLRGRYYFRSGSTNQELTGSALNEFLLKKAGRAWDDAIEPEATLADIDLDAVREYLLMSEKAGRLPERGDSLGTGELLEKLRLAKNGRLKRAAIVFFGKDPG